MLVVLRVEHASLAQGSGASQTGDYNYIVILGLIAVCYSLLSSTANVVRRCSLIVCYKFFNFHSSVASRIRCKKDAFQSTSHDRL